MNTHLKVSFICVLALGFAVGVVADSSADWLERITGKDKKTSAPQKALRVGGEFSGYIKDEIEVAGETVLITDDTTIYVVGDGIEEGATYFPSGTYINVTGGADGAGEASLVIVILRPRTGGSLEVPEAVEDLGEEGESPR